MQESEFQESLRNIIKLRRCAQFGSDNQEEIKRLIEQVQKNEIRAKQDLDLANKIVSRITNEFKVRDTYLEKSKKVGIDDPDQYGNTALHYAASNGNAWLVAQLINANANLNVKNLVGRTPLIEAAYSSQAEVVGPLIKEEGRILINASDGEGYTALHYAAYNGDIGSVEKLLDAKANNSCATTQGRTALDCAYNNPHSAETKKLEMINVMLARGCVCNHPTQLLNFLILYNPENLQVLTALRLFCQMKNLSPNVSVRAESYLANLTESINQQKFSIVNEINLFPLDLTNMILGYEDKEYKPRKSEYAAELQEEKSSPINTLQGLGKGLLTLVSLAGVFITSFKAKELFPLWAYYTVIVAEIMLTLFLTSNKLIDAFTNQFPRAQLNLR